MIRLNKRFLAEEMRLKLRVDAYLLLQKAHPLSEVAMTALKSATRMPGGRWEMSCSDHVAKELWTWFDACEAVSAHSRWSVWKVGVCQWSKWEIEEALAKHTSPSYERAPTELDLFIAKVTDTLVQTRLAHERSAALREQSQRTRSRALAGETQSLRASRLESSSPPELAGGSDDATALDEKARLRERAREAIVRGKLSAETSYRAEGGPSLGGVCAVCGRRLLPRELEYEVEFDQGIRHAGPAMFHLHVACFQAWEIERRLAR